MMIKCQTSRRKISLSSLVVVSVCLEGRRLSYQNDGDAPRKIEYNLLRRPIWAWHRILCDPLGTGHYLSPREVGGL